MSSDRLTTLEASYLWFEEQGRPIHVGGVATFEAGPLLDQQGDLRIRAIERHVSERLAQVPRLRQRIATHPWDLDRPRWVDDPDFDLANHVRTVRAPEPGDEAAFRRVAERLVGEVFDPHHPLWQLCVVTGLDGDRVGLVERAHHALVDGMGGVDLAALFLDIDRAGPTRRTGPAELGSSVAPLAPTARLGGSLFADAVYAGLETPAQLVRAGTAAVTHPAATARALAVLARGWANVAQDGTFAPPASLNVIPGPRRQLAWVRSRLDDVRAAGHAFGGTVNDAVLAAVTAGLRALLVERREPLPHDLALKALVPVSGRGAEAVPTLGNQVSGVLAPLPVGIADPAERLATIVATMRRLKTSGETHAIDSFLHTADLLPPPLARLMVRGMDHQPFVNLVVTNVPGPPIPLYLLGSEMLEAFPVVPLGANLAVGVAILSYNGALNIGLTADADACADVDVLAEGIEHGLAELGATAA